MIVLSGGTGTPKLLFGLKALLEPSELSVVVNTADDIWISGNLVSPDLDTVLYTLAGIVDKTRWWGIGGDSFRTSEHLRKLGSCELLALGDMDRAVHIFRSELLRKGESLTRATQLLARALGVEHKVIPMSNDPVSTMITTTEGEMHFQEFWVERRGEPDVVSLRYKGIEDARPSPDFIDLFRREETVLIGPSNPVTSIGPILALPGVRNLMEEMRVVAVSPFVGDKPVSGPAARFMRASGIPADDQGVAAILGRIDLFIVDRKSSFTGRCVRLDTLMRSGEESLRLARKVVELISCS
jgi:LPPG:FO 2-phospho-L-lactate transferase